ncbi:MAG: glutamine-hydrolyzing carbamoyl-phosphate synthase small subunit [Proteobacteria bacterium]|nr:glutamine-hydrolyzing carbamoyl-phosphate synthase small subunit [Pseudomonadota bacterium]
MPTPQESKCTLSLSNGQSFQGQLIGAPFETSGELVFTTGMVGYSEALTDPSYFGQILVFTYPLIGNYGIPKLTPSISIEDSRGFESNKVHASAVILAIDSAEAFHWTSHQTLDKWLLEQGVPGITCLDPRQLVHLIREHGGLLGRVIPERSLGFKNPLTSQIEVISKPPQNEAVFFDPSSHNVLPAVSCKERRVILPKTGNGQRAKRIALLDCGVKWNIVRQVLQHGAEVELVPWDTDLANVDCSGWLLSNGPGDPTKTGDLRQRISHLTQSNIPILGICLGHQLLALSIGASTERMQYGHRSHNQPVQLVGTRKGYITSQNHGYVVVDKTLPEGWVPWFINANDFTVEGLRHVTKPQRSVQFHPEAAGGPRDTGWIIEQFVKEI